jgi:hypothetical protein
MLKFPVGDTFEFVLPFRFQVGIALCWGKVKQNERDLFWGAEAIKQSSKSVWGARHFSELLHTVQLEDFRTIRIGLFAERLNSAGHLLPFGRRGFVNDHAENGIELLFISAEDGPAVYHYELRLLKE